MKSIRITPFTDAALTEEILALKKKKHAVILAHYYQTPDIQDLADYVGDSLGLSQQAAKTDADIIVFAGVHFMAETAKILNPTKKVVLPDLAASCSLAEGCLPDDFARFLKLYPDHKVISYVNCSAEIKAMSDVICTSANAEKNCKFISKKSAPHLCARQKSWRLHQPKRPGEIWCCGMVLVWFMKPFQ